MTNTHAPLALRADAPAEKWCNKCEKWLSVDDFHRSTRCKDGRQLVCKLCRKLYGQQHRARKADVQRQYLSTERGKEVKARAAVTARERHPDKHLARYTLGNAIKNGVLQRQPCQFCGNKKSQAHHEDYSKPLDVIWACFKCHREILHGQTVIVVGGKS